MLLRRGRSAPAHRPARLDRSPQRSAARSQRTWGPGRPELRHQGADLRQRFQPATLAPGPRGPTGPARAKKRERGRRAWTWSPPQSG